MREENKKIVVITGGSKGIGLACTELFNAKDQYQVIVLARNEYELKEKKLKNVTFIATDIRDYRQVQKALSSYSNVDLLINCAGIAGFGKIWEQDIIAQHNLIDTNIKGMLNVLNCVLPNMIKNNHGNIVCLSSIIGRISLDQPFSVYTATKFATNALCEGIRKEVSPHNIRVLNISPGAVNTTLTDNLKDVPVACQRNNTRSIKAHDIANIIYFAYNQPQDLSIKEIILTNTINRI